MTAREFPGHDTPIDVFYGKSLVVPSRADEWAAEGFANAQNTEPRRPKREGLLEPLDLELLERMGRYASTFTREVRLLPCFRQVCNGKQTPREGFVVSTSSLDDREAKFEKNFAAASHLLL